MKHRLLTCAMVLTALLLTSAPASAMEGSVWTCPPGSGTMTM